MERFIAERFRSFGGGLALDTGAISKYTDLIDLSIGDTDIVTDEKIISAAFRDAKAGHTHYGDPHGTAIRTATLSLLMPFAVHGTRISGSRSTRSAFW